MIAVNAIRLQEGQQGLISGHQPIDLLWRQDFLESSLKDLGAGDRPFRAMHLSPCPVARDFTNPLVDIGMAGVMGGHNDCFEAWRATCRGSARRVANVPKLF